MKSLIFSALAIVLLATDSTALAERYLLDRSASSPKTAPEVVGNIRFARANEKETLIDLARRFGLGYDEIVKPNNRINRWVPDPKARIILPTQYILPNSPRKGVVLNVAELRLYYFPYSGDEAGRVVYTYPVSIGRRDWKTPRGKTKIVRKDKNPPWYPPESIRREHAAEGDILPKVVPGGDPENPLGKFALRLSLPSYLIHGTDQRKASGIGMRVTHGCVRLYPEDIERLFHQTKVGTPVYIVDQAVKVGIRNGVIFLEVHTPLAEEDYQVNIKPDQVYRLLDKTIKASFRVSKRLVEQVTKRGDGVPVAIGTIRSSTRERID